MIYYFLNVGRGSSCLTQVGNTAVSDKAVSSKTVSNETMSSNAVSNKAVSSVDNGSSVGNSNRVGNSVVCNGVGNRDSLRVGSSSGVGDLGDVTINVVGVVVDGL